MSKKKKNSNYKHIDPTATPKEKPADKKKALKIGLGIAAALLLALVIGITAYLMGGYEATDDAKFAMLEDEWLSVDDQEGQLVFTPTQATLNETTKELTTGFIFYPGANVDHHAYAPLMSELSRQGILCVIVDMPLDHAFLDIDAADDILEDYPDIQHWYIGGHSLGGSMAAEYVADHTDRFEGLVLLASYSTKDLSDTDLKVATLYGDRDKILNMDNYEKNLKNLPEGYIEDVIEGGNHANFGSYGEQDGDGPAGVSTYVQCKVTSEKILELMGII
ncbi:MAG: alpha/beta fold hydrolase [Oscillospiraceae bacterium]|nr:alpha/beta fold hydrolase [Oscillospiraceae bacterium]